MFLRVRQEVIFKRNLHFAKRIIYSGMLVNSAFFACAFFANRMDGRRRYDYSLLLSGSVPMSTQCQQATLKLSLDVDRLQSGLAQALLLLITS
jgi:hypothetical protein